MAEELVRIPIGIAPPEPRRRANRVHTLALTAVAVLLWGAAALVGRSSHPPAAGAPAASAQEPLEILARIEVGTQPGSIAAGADGIWITVAEGLALVDPGEDRVVRTIPGPDAFAYSFAVERDGILWVQQGNITTTATPSIVRIDPEASVAEEIAPFNIGPHGIAVGFGSVWAVDIDGGVTRIDPETGSVLVRIPIEGPAWGIDAGEGAVWVAGMHGVFRIDPETNTVAATIDLAWPTDVSVGAGGVWVTASVPGPSKSSGIVARIDPGTNLSTMQTPFLGAHALAATDDAVWVIGHMPAQLSAIDPATGEVERRIVVGSLPLVDVAWGHGSVWVAECCHGGRLLRIG